MNKGFTLVEVIAVIVILSLLIVITTPAYDTISTSIKKRNYESKQNTIASETLNYVEKYMKDKVYGGKDNSKNICFKVGFLIKNGIISSDSDKEEYILNDITAKKFKDDDTFIVVSYNTETLKLETKMPDKDDVFNVTCNMEY